MKLFISLPHCTFNSKNNRNFKDELHVTSHLRGTPTMLFIDLKTELKKKNPPEQRKGAPNLEWVTLHLAKGAAPSRVPCTCRTSPHFPLDYSGQASCKWG